MDIGSLEFGKVNTVNIDQVEVYEENPRTVPSDNEDEAIGLICFDQGDKLINLAKDILEQGLSPLELIGVFPVKGKLKVKEGNRRVTAIKLIRNPNLIEGEYPKLFRGFKKLHDQLNGTRFFDRINVYVAENEAQLDRWMEIKHLGEQEGKGTVSWNALQSERHKAKTNRQSKEYLFISNLVANKYIDETTAFEDISLTNWQRVLTPTFSPFFGVEKKDGIYQIVDSNLFDTVFPSVIHEIKGQSVKVVYDNEAKLKLIRKVYQDLSLPEPYPDDNKQQELFATPKEKTPKKKIVDLKNKPKSVPRLDRSLNRKTLIPQTQVFFPRHQKTEQVIMELKKLFVANYPYAVSITFRTLIDLALRELSENHEEYSYNGNQLESGLTKAIHTFFGNDQTKKDMHKSMKTASKSISLLNGAVHSLEGIVEGNSIKQMYDALVPFFEFAFSDN